MKRTIAQIKIQEAFILLSRYLPFQKITIQQVTLEAKVSRATFYVYFKNKQDLICAVSDYMLYHMHETAQRFYANKTFCMGIESYPALARHIHQNQDLFIELMGPDGDLSFKEKWKDVFCLLFENRLIIEGQNKTPILQKSVELISAGLIDHIIESFQKRKYLITLNTFYTAELILRSILSQAS